MRRPLLGLLVVVLMGIGGYFALGATATGFLPAMDEGAFVLDFFLPAGTALEETDRVARRLDRILEDTPSVATFTRRTGADTRDATPRLLAAAALAAMRASLQHWLHTGHAQPLPDIVNRAFDQLANGLE